MDKQGWEALARGTGCPFDAPRPRSSEHSDFVGSLSVSSLYLAKNGIQVVGIDVDWQRVKAANHAAVKMGFLKALRSERLRQEMSDGNGKLPRKRPKVIRHSRMQLAGIHTTPDWMPDKSVGA